MEHGLWLTYAILAAALVGSIMFSMEKPVELRFFSIWRVFALDVPKEGSPKEAMCRVPTCRPPQREALHD